MHHLLRSYVLAVHRVVSLSVLLALVSFGSANAQLTLLESGFTIEDLGSSVGAKKIECSPGGIWGDYVYVADSGGDFIERIDLTGFVTVFATLDPGSFPVGIAFGPGPGSNFGDFLYVSNFGLSEIEKIDQFGNVSLFTNTVPSPVSNTFDPSGAYGNDMFVTTGYTGPIYQVDEFGAATVFAMLPALYIKFGPGGAWGSGMYSTSQSAVGIVTVDMAGVVTNFATGFTSPEGFDWAPGPFFLGDMFATDVSAGQIWRIKDDGTKIPWATLPGAADVAFCNGALYIVQYHGGGCYKVTPDEPLPATFRTIDAVAGDGAVTLRWNITADEPMAGFDIYRSEGDATALQSILSGGRLESSATAYEDMSVRPGVTYSYVVAAVTPDGREFRSTPVQATTAMLVLAAHNYPNPFNPVTTIEYTLPDAEHVTLSIYDARGQLVVNLESGVQPGGTHKREWNGADGKGRPVASGTYFYRLTAGKRTLTQKLVLLK
jgi:hypothetical protein